ncbi:MAG: Asp23/Gls24 family envelope stress response protein [Peptostreptococcales bacterium]
MKVVALIGKSGTGKSYQALNITKEENIEYIIDDGILIYKNKIIAGKSAKREATKIGAVKRALFSDIEHRENVKSILEKAKPDAILIIGTSQNMINKIIEVLGLESPTKTIFIEDITTERERDIAKKQRYEFGKHVIPVPTMQLKYEFSGYFVDPLRIFKKFSSGKNELNEKSVVRPTYSYLGRYIISERVIMDIVDHVASLIEGIHEVSKISTISTSIGIDIHIDLNVLYDYNIVDLSQKLQKNIKTEVEKMTALNVLNIHLYVKNIHKRVLR